MTHRDVRALGVAGPRRGRTVVIGIGNELRRDDGVGPAVVERLRGRLPDDVDLVISGGDPAQLIEAWQHARLAVVVDAVRADPPRPGRRHRFVLDEPGTGATRAGPAAPAAASTHGFGVDAALGLARALDLMPRRLIVHAIEAADLTLGTGMTPQVEAAVTVAADDVRRDVTGSS